MLRVIRILLSVSLAIFTISLTAAPAQTLAEVDLQATRASFAAAQGGDWNRAYAELAPPSDPLPLKILRWMDYSRPGAPGRFSDIAEFIQKNPDWPRQKALRKHAEEALAGEADDVAADWFKRFPPVSAVGQVRCAEIMLNSGNLEGGIAALRAAWIDGDFGPLDATRVPAKLRADPGLIYEELRWRARKDMVNTAVQILLSQPGDLVRPGVWWAERQTIARRVLATGDAALAYRLAEQHGLIEGNAYSEAEFLLGYIALRYMKNPVIAFDHFARILTRVGTPYAKARAGYWGGRAAEAQARPELAAKWYAAAADYMVTFYGQLAAHKLGDDAPPHPVPEPVSDPAERGSPRSANFS